MWELECEESWALKNWYFWTVVLEKTLESLMACKEIQQVHSKGDQSWVFFGRNDAKAETLILWPTHVKIWLIGEGSDAGRDWGQEEKGTTEDEMAWWHHWLDGHEFEWTSGVGDGKGDLECCSSLGRQESDTTERLNWTELNWTELNGIYRVGNLQFSRVGLKILKLYGNGSCISCPVTCCQPVPKALHSFRMSLQGTWGSEKTMGHLFKMLAPAPASDLAKDLLWRDELWMVSNIATCSLLFLSGEVYLF